jgi:anti-sigma B factor antagonist
MYGPRKSRIVTSQPPNLTINVKSEAETLTIALSGEADLLGAPKIEAALNDASIMDPGPSLIMIDLRNLTFIDSSGLHALLTGHERCRVRGQELRIIRGPENVQRLFELTGMQETLPFADAAELDATDAISPSGSQPEVGAA